MEMRYGISSLGQMPSSCTMQPWAPVQTAESNMMYLRLDLRVACRREVLECALDLADPSFGAHGALSSAIRCRAKGPQENAMRRFLPYRCAEINSLSHRAEGSAGASSHHSV